MKIMIKMINKIDKIRKRLFLQLNNVQKDCVNNAYDPKIEKWNPEHFKYCEGDLLAAKLDLLDEIVKGENKKK